MQIFLKIIIRKVLFQRNTSQFSIFLEYENPCSFFICQFVLHTLFFYRMNALVYFDDEGIHIRGEKVARNEN